VDRVKKGISKQILAIKEVKKVFLVIRRICIFVKEKKKKEILKTFFLFLSIF